MSEISTIKRLMTDTTGQNIVTALNNIASVVKPDATEINMGPNDSTKVASAIASNSEAITTLNSKITKKSANITASQGITIIQQNSFYYDIGLKCIELQFQVTEQKAKGNTILTLPDGLKPAGYIGMIIVDTNGNNTVKYGAYADSSGAVKTEEILPTGYYVVTVTYG